MIAGLQSLTVATVLALAASGPAPDDEPDAVDDTAAPQDESAPAPDPQADPSEGAPEEPAPDPIDDEDDEDDEPQEGPAESEESPEPEPEPGPPPVSDPAARRQQLGGVPPSGRDRDLVRRVLIGGGIASLTIGVGLSAPAIFWGAESVRAKKAARELDAPGEADERRAAEQRRDDLKVRAIAVGAVAGAYAVTGIVMLALTGRDRPRKSSVTPTAGRGTFGVVWTGRF